MYGKFHENFQVVSQNGLTEEEEHNATVKAICGQLQKDTGLYNCLMNSKDSDGINQCFATHGAHNNALKIDISGNQAVPTI